MMILHLKIGSVLLMFVLFLRRVAETYSGDRPASLAEFVNCLNHT